MNSSIIALLQLAASMLISLQQNPSLSYEEHWKAVTFASQTIQTTLQAMGRVPEPPAQYIPPSINQLRSAEYLDASGKMAPLGEKFELLDGFISFGDLNRDNLDDAIVFLKSTSPGKAPEYSMAALVSHNGWLENVARKDLGSSLEIYSHDVIYGQFTADMKVGSEPRKIQVYQLVGKTLVQI